jgi:hypothetical protein
VTERTETIITTTDKVQAARAEIDRLRKDVCVNCDVAHVDCATCSCDTRKKIVTLNKNIRNLYANG